MNIVKKTCRKLKNIFDDVLSLFNFLIEKRIKRNGEKINIVFICQYIPAWNKLKPIYELLNEDSRFKTTLLCVPNQISNMTLDKNRGTINDTYDYFVSHGYDAVNAIEGRDCFIDIKSFQPDYVFYPRPYNFFMPAEYNTRKVSKYARICHIMYGMPMTKDVLKVCIDKDFFRNVYCYYAETEYIKEFYRKKRFRLKQLLKLQTVKSLGMPVFGDILKNKNEETHNWDFAFDSYKIMWTPRWTTDLSLGGSNFFTYCDSVLEYAKLNKNVSFLLRPHPLMFDNFIKTGEMTVGQVEEYKKRCLSLSNVKFDEEKEYAATFWGSDAIVTDISGILPEYFITGKPIVYCATNMVLTPTADTQRIIDSCYIVNNEKELFDRITSLAEGKDEKRELRKQTCDKLFGKYIEFSSKSIVEDLFENANRVNRKTNKKIN